MPVFSQTGLWPYRRHPVLWIGFCLVTGICSLVVVQDFLESSASKGRFHLSESFIFSGFWWLFPPLLLLQQKMLHRRTVHRRMVLLLFLVLPAGLHCLAFPLLTDSLGRIFLGHGFRWTNSFLYGITEYLYILLPVYLFPLFLNRPIHRTAVSPSPSPTVAALHDAPRPLLDAIIVSHGGEQMRIHTREIRYFRSASPYVCLHTKERQYLVHQSLRQLSETLDPEVFIRIHKTLIVNTRYLVSVKTRQNGDYDLRLDDGTMLRLSRSYLASFRKFYTASTQVNV